MKSKEHNETKQLLLDISKELFNLKSFDSVSVDEICKNAGVTKGSFYHHFKSKYDIPIQQYRQIQNEFFEDYNKCANYDTQQRFHRAIMWYANYCTEDKLNIFTNYQRVMINSDKNRVLRRIEMESRVFNELLTVGVADGTFKESINIDFYTELITRFISSLLLDWVIFKSNINLKEDLNYFYENLILIIKKR